MSHGTTGDALRDVLALVLRHPPASRTLAHWTLDQREQAANWALACYERMSDTRVHVPRRPEVLRGFA